MQSKIALFSVIAVESATFFAATCQNSADFTHLILVPDCFCKSGDRNRCLNQQESSYVPLSVSELSSLATVSASHCSHSVCSFSLSDFTSARKRATSASYDVTDDSAAVSETFQNTCVLVQAHAPSQHYKLCLTA